MSGNLGVDFFVRSQAVPQTVDLVQHHQPPGSAADMVAPDGEIRLGDAGVGGEDEQYGVGAGQQGQGQFRFRADGIEAWCVQDDQPLLEKRMREVDHGVTPTGDLHLPLGIRLQAAIGAIADGKAERLGGLGGNALDFADAAQGFGHALRRTVREGEIPPCLGYAAQVGDAGPLGPCFDRQQGDARRLALVPGYLGRTHRGASRRGWQDTATPIGEEKGIDQFGLAPRELGDESDDELVLGEAAANAP